MFTKKEILDYIKERVENEDLKVNIVQVKMEDGDLSINTLKGEQEKDMLVEVFKEIESLPQEAFEHSRALVIKEVKDALSSALFDLACNNVGRRHSKFEVKKGDKSE